MECKRVDCVKSKTKTLFNIVKIFSSKPLKIARESLNIEKESNQTPEGNQEWRKFVGSIRRKVQRHASTSGEAVETATVSQNTKPDPLSRKNSLTQSQAGKFELFKRERSVEEAPTAKSKEKKCDKQQLMKQKSIGLETASKTDYFRALSFKDKSKSVSVKHVDKLLSTAACSKGGDDQKGVRNKSDKNKDSDKTLKPSISFSRIKGNKKESTGLKQDDFLKATMRIFLVVSPPVGKIQVKK